LFLTFISHPDVGEFLTLAPMHNRSIEWKELDILFSRAVSSAQRKMQNGIDRNEYLSLERIKASRGWWKPGVKLAGNGSGSCAPKRGNAE
jgi:hypothetical protein